MQLLTTQLIKKSDLGFHGNLFGGTLMAWIDTAAAAKKLGITEAELTAAFGNKMPPDFAAAAKKLGITEAELKLKLGVK